MNRSKEKAIQFRTFGTSPEVIYATLTDSQPAPGEFVLLTQGPQGPGGGSERANNGCVADVGLEAERLQERMRRTIRGIQNRE